MLADRWLKDPTPATLFVYPYELCVHLLQSQTLESVKLGIALNKTMQV